MADDQGPPPAAAPPARRRTRRFEARRRAIITAAAGFINRKGMRGMTLAEVAAKLDLAPTGVIYYFPSKEALAGACYMESLERIGETVDIGATGSSAPRRLERFLDAYYDLRQRIARREAAPMANFNDLRALGPGPVSDAYSDLFRRIRALAAPDNAEGMSHLELNARGHLLTVEIFWSIAWLHRHEPEDYGRVSRRVFDILANGIAAPGADWTPVRLPALRLTRDTEGEVSRETFLRAATALINEQGYLGASVEKISARLNVTKGAFYHYNEDKDDLVKACFDRSFEIMGRMIRSAEELAGSGLKALTSIAATLANREANGEAMLLRNSAMTSAPLALRPRLMRRFDRLADRMASLISDGIADGSIRPVDANIAAQMVNAMINGSAQLRTWAPGVTEENAAELYVKPLFLGLFPAK